MKVDRLDHLVLTVRNIEVTCDFYNRVLEMQVVTFGKGRRALLFGQQKINLHEVGREFEPKAAKPTAGSADLCFITNESLSKVLDHLTECGVEVIDGPGRRTGALGEIESVYFRDPDLNLIEVSVYIPALEGANKPSELA